MAQEDEESSAHRSASRWHERATAVEKRAHKPASASGVAAVPLAPAESLQQVGGLSLRPRATRQRAHAAATALSLIGSKCVVWSASSVAQGAGGVDQSVEL